MTFFFPSVAVHTAGAYLDKMSGVSVSLFLREEKGTQYWKYGAWKSSILAADLGVNKQA